MTNAPLAARRLNTRPQVEITSTATAAAQVVTQSDNPAFTTKAPKDFQPCGHGDEHVAVYARAFLILDGIVIRDLDASVLEAQYRIIVPKSTISSAKVLSLFPFALSFL